MANSQISRGGWLAIGLGVLGGLIAIANEIMRFRRSGAVDWGHVAIALGVPVLIYAMVRSRSTRQP